MDAESAHRSVSGSSAPRTVRAGPCCGSSPGRIRRCGTQALGLSFPSPFGLAAGFDKEGHGVEALADLGFGAVEVGTITGQAQPGNPPPRLFRLVEDRAVINRMGFNNDGAAAVARAEAARPALARRLPARRARSSA